MAEFVWLPLDCVAAMLATAGLAVALARSARATPVVYGLTLFISALAGTVALVGLLDGAAVASGVTLPLGLPWIGAHFRLDRLSSFFLVVVNLGGAVTSLYGLGHGRHEPAPARVLPFFAAFLAGMNLVVLADDAFSFLVAWEFMSLTSWALVLAHHREAANRQAGFVYLLMASFGTFALLLAFGLLAGPEGGYAFAAMRSGVHAPLTTALVIVLMLVGAGSKAGLVPLHVWLPLAHPAAPSHVSALMSAVMTKVAIYGFIRVVFDLVGAPPWWAGLVLLVVGSLTAVVGIVSALMETDLKRLLAYSTIENVGVIFVSLGLALAFRANGMAAAAALALVAALLHVFNHSLFKSLLFLGAGAVLAAAGSRDMDRLGGLIHRLPVTSVLVLVGCLAIAALPPLNGFASEWLAFQAVLLSPELPQWTLKLAAPAAGGMLALAAALAAAAFVKAYGISFLGRPRSTEAAAAGEVDRLSLAAMAILAGLSLIAGIVPGLVIDALAPVTEALVGGRLPPQAPIAWLSLVPVAASRSSYNGLLVFGFIAISVAFAVWVSRRFGTRAAPRRVPVWAGGHPELTPAMQYSASSFSQPIRRVFGGVVLGAREQVQMPAPGDPAAARFTVRLTDISWAALYAPLGRGIDRLAERLDFLQFLTIRRHLGIVFLLLVAMLAVVAIWR